MEELYSISLSVLIDEFQFEELYVPEIGKKNILIKNPEVDRPGLALAGFYDVFDSTRMQLLGKAEFRYLSEMKEETRKERIKDLFQKQPACIVITTNFDPYEEMLEYAKEYQVPIVRTKEKTSPVMAALIASLNNHLASRITRHGVLVEVYGEGILILGDSGIGKSETAIELVKRGHRLIADDAVEIKKVSAKTLVGSAPEIIKHYVELRGIGIIDVCRIFGMGAVKNTERIDLIINLEPWVEGKMYDRFGLEEESQEILGISVPAITIPVRPGRNLAIILEIAAMNNRQKKMGYNTAEEFNKKLTEQFESGIE